VHQNSEQRIAYEIEDIVCNQYECSKCAPSEGRKQKSSAASGPKKPQAPQAPAPLAGGNLRRSPAASTD